MNKIKEYDNNITNKKVVEKKLKNVSSKFEHVITIIKESKNLSKLSISELMSSLKVCINKG